MNALGIRDRIRQAEVAGPAQGRAARPAADVATGQHQHDARRLRLLRLALRRGMRASRTLSRFKLPEFDRLYEKARAMPDGPERLAVERKMSELVRRVRAVGADGIPLRERARAAVAARLQVQPDVSNTRSRTSTSIARAAMPRKPRPKRSAGSRAVAAPIAAGARALTAATPHASPGATCLRAACRGAGLIAIRPAPSRRADGGAVRMQKTLRVAFPVAETGFDPQATQRPLFRQRPARDLRNALWLRLPRAPVPAHPRTIAAALPKSPTAGAAGRFTCGRASISPTIRRSRAGEARADRRRLRLFVEAPPRSRGCARRSRGTCRARSSAPTRSSTRRSSSGKFDYDAPIEGLYAPDRYTIRIKLKEPDYILFGYLCSSPMAAVAREVIERYGDAQRLGDGPPGRHRPVHAEIVAARAADRARGESRFSRRALSRGDRSRPISARLRPDAGQAAAAGRPHRDLDHGGGQSAPARVRQPRARLRRPARRS